MRSRYLDTVKPEIIKLYREGVTAKELCSRFKVAKSTMSYILRGVSSGQSPEDVRVLRSRRASEQFSRLNTAERAARSERISRSLLEYYAHNPYVATRVERQQSYTALERTYLDFLSERYGPLSHARVGTVWFDFVNDKYVIETTEDYGKGVTSATQRFEKISDDRRDKILFCNTTHLGKVRLARLTELNVSVYDIACISTGVLTAPIQRPKLPTARPLAAHGTLTRYRTCKCELCRSAKQHYNAQYRRK